jgi:DHA1 family bicyclomycin/chloramphenicol resistance-like MFS transporter
MAATYRTLFRDREFMIYAVILFGGQFGSFSTIASAPVIIVGTLGISPDRYGYFSAVVSLGYLCGSALTNRVAGRISGSRMLLGVGYGQCTAAILMIGASLLPPLTPWHVIVPMALFMVNNGMAVPNAFSGAVALYPRVAGTASALSGFLQGCGGVAGILAAYLLPKGLAAVLALALMLPVVIMLTTGLLLRFRYRRLPPPGGRT